MVLVDCRPPGRIDRISWTGAIAAIYCPGVQRQTKFFASGHGWGDSAYEVVMETGASRASMAYVRPYETAERIFGASLSASDLTERVRPYSWRESLLRLADLASVVANTPGHADSERVRKLTIDPLAKLTGSAQGILANARVAVAQRRDGMILAHEEAILFLEHLVILEGAESGSSAPGDAEIALWLAGANSHLQQSWPDSATQMSVDESIAADLVRLSRYNNKPDLLRALVRAESIFGTPPAMTPLGQPLVWDAFQREAFGKSFVEFFETGPALLAIMTRVWGAEDTGRPPFFERRWLSSSTLSPNDILGSVSWMTGSRDSIATATRKRLRPDGLPHCPTALLHTPIVDVGDGFIVASPASLVNQLRTGIWARYLVTAKSGKVGIDVDGWNSAFGYMVEGWCGRVAAAARESPRCVARIVLPSFPGAPDEVEDVVIIENGVAVLFSVKSRLVDARASREGLSPDITLSWFDEFFFSAKNKKHRAGAASLLSKRIDMLRAGAFEPQGVPRDLRIYPVIVTYDCLGENDLLYRRLQEGCQQRSLLQQADVGPLTIARLEDFEELMVRASAGKSVSGVLMNRERGDRHRRLDQIIYEVNGPGVADRFALFDDGFRSLGARVQERLTGARGGEAK